MEKLFRENYIASPTAAASLAFWKAEKFVIPENMLVLRDDDFLRRINDNNHALLLYTDEPYFKLIHRMKPGSIIKPELPRGYSLCQGTAEEFSRHIRLCYGGGPSVKEIEDFKTHFTHDPALWLMLKNESTGSVAASGIAEMDGRIDEGILEWVQVSPDERRKGLGRCIVSELLFRMREKADFVTVSGMLNDANKPLELYKACGFTDMVVWHVLTRKS